VFYGSLFFVFFFFFILSLFHFCSFFDCTMLLCLFSTLLDSFVIFYSDSFSLLCVVSSYRLCVVLFTVGLFYRGWGGCVAG